MDTSIDFYYQVHKYKNGHQLLSTSITLDRNDQDTIDRLSDISGQIRPGELFAPYFTLYPLPSKNFFVVARTWQDLFAPRAGCVITSSIVIPMLKWERLIRLQDIFSLLERPPAESNPGLETRPALINKSTADSPVVEVVEALFLEQRKPVLIFDCDSEEAIIYRLYMAFWPGMRRTFATCTFALSPRTISGRPFDLTFSLNDLRSRFVDWTGRRIEGLHAFKKTPRHRWTLELAKRIFEGEEPSLLSKSSLAMFQSNGLDDESRIRLGLLWDELFEKASHDNSPFAVLGLLDIINSQQVFETSLYMHVQPLILNAISNAISILKALDAWKFYAAVLLKHRKKMMTREMIFAVKNACTELATQNPFEGLEFFKDNENSGKTLPTLLYASFGDGVASVYEIVSIIIDNSIFKTALLVIATSKSFANTFTDYFVTHSVRAFSFLENALFSAEVKYRNSSKSNLASFCVTAYHEGIIKLLFTNNTIPQYQKLINTIGEKTNYHIREFDEAILEEGRLLDSESVLLENIAEHHNAPNSTALVVRILAYKHDLVDSFYQDYRFDLTYRDKTVTALFEELSVTDVQSLILGNNIKRHIVDKLLSDTTGDFEKAIALLYVSEFPYQQVITRLNKLPEAKSQAIQPSRFVKFLCNYIDKFTESDTTKVTVIIAKLYPSSARSFIHYTFNALKSGELDFKIIKILIDSGDVIKSILTDQIDELSDLLNRYLDENDEQILNYWLSLFDAAEKTDNIRDSALSMMEFAYKQIDGDPTPILVKVFPVVYDMFLQDRTLPRRISFVFFPDWDRCRTLRNDLVERYERSDWPKLGLFDVAKSTNILKEVMVILNDSKTGKKFLAEAMLQANELSITDEYRQLYVKDKTDKVDKATDKKKGRKKRK